MTVRYKGATHNDGGDCDRRMDNKSNYCTVSAQITNGITYHRFRSARTRWQIACGKVYSLAFRIRPNCQTAARSSRTQSFHCTQFRTRDPWRTRTPRLGTTMCRRSPPARPTRTPRNHSGTRSWRCSRTTLPTSLAGWDPNSSHRKCWCSAS